MKGKKIINDRLYQEMTFGLMVLPGTALYILFLVVPIVWGFYFSFTNFNGISQRYSYVGFENYINAFNSPRFLSSLSFTLRYSLCLVIIVTALSLCLAMILNYKFPLRKYIRGIYFLPAVLSGLTVGIIFDQLFARALPVMGELLNIEVLTKSVLSRKDTVFWALLYVHVWQGLAIPTILFMAGLQVIPEEIQEAAMIDGASKAQRFRLITVPFLMPIISIVLILTLRSGLLVFEYIVAITSGGPGGSTESLAYLIYNHGFIERRFSSAAAEAMMMAVLICSFSFIQISWTNKKRVYQ